MPERAGDVSTVAGSGGSGSVDGEAGDATFDTPLGLAVDEPGCCVYVSDYGANNVRKIMQPGANHPAGTLHPVLRLA